MTSDKHPHGHDEERETKEVEQDQEPTERPGMQTVLVPRDEADLMPHIHNRRAYFGRHMRLLLYIMETDQHIPVIFDNQVILGREQTSLDNQTSVIDLTPHNAAQLGVSRRHAKLIRSTATIMIEDLGTLNGSYLNGVKLSPGQTHVLSDGDELRLGKMVLAVIFDKTDQG